jgi:hypothetical protein
MTNGDEQKRTDHVIGEAQDSHEELLAAITKLERYANALRRAADRTRPPGDGEGGLYDQ